VRVGGTHPDVSSGVDEEREVPEGVAWQRKASVISSHHATGNTCNSNDRSPMRFNDGCPCDSAEGIQGGGPACPFSTGGGTRRVQSVREGGERGDLGRAARLTPPQTPAASLAAPHAATRATQDARQRSALRRARAADGQRAQRSRRRPRTPSGCGAGGQGTPGAVSEAGREPRTGPGAADQRRRERA
jgi:hypothetical protein